MTSLGVGSKLNIAVVHPSLFARGGSQRYAVESHSYFVGRGHQAKLFSYVYNPRECYPELLIGDRVAAVRTVRIAHTLGSALRGSRVRPLIQRLERWFALETAGSFLAACWRAWTTFRLLDRSSAAPYDWLFVNEVGSAVWAAYLYKLRRRARALVFCYDTPDKLSEWRSVGPYSAMARVVRSLIFAFDRFAMRRAADKVAVLDQMMAKRCEDFYRFAPMIIPGGVDLKRFQNTRCGKLRSRLGLSAGTRLIVNVSRFARYRRIADLILAYQDLAPELRERSALFLHCPITEPDYFDECNALIDGSNGTRIFIDTEFCDDAALSAILADADIFAFPNENQTWGNAVLEAMSAGKPCVVSTGCGIVSAVADAVMTYPCGDRQRLSAALSQLLTDEDLRRSLGERGAEMARQRFSWQAWGDRLLSEMGDSRSCAA